MITLRWAFLVAAAVCTAAVVIIGTWNGAALLALVLIALAALTSSGARGYLLRELASKRPARRRVGHEGHGFWVGTDPDPQLSRLDVLDRPCCLVDHAESAPTVEAELHGRDGARR